MLKRSKDVKLSDRALCWLLRSVVLMVFVFVGLGAWLAARGNPGALNQAVMLLALGSMLAFVTQAFADANGVYSRLGLLNSLVYLYSLAWLPLVGVFSLWRLTQGEFGEASSALLVGGIFWLIGYSTRTRRRQREQSEHAL